MLCNFHDHGGVAHVLVVSLSRRNGKKAEEKKYRGRQSVHRIDGSALLSCWRASMRAKCSRLRMQYFKRFLPLPLFFGKISSGTDRAAGGFERFVNARTRALRARTFGAVHVTYARCVSRTSSTLPALCVSTVAPIYLPATAIRCALTVKP